MCRIKLLNQTQEEEEDECLWRAYNINSSVAGYNALSVLLLANSSEPVSIHMTINSRGVVDGGQLDRASFADHPVHPGAFFGQRCLDRLLVSVARLEVRVERVLIEVDLADGGQEAVDRCRELVDLVARQDLFSVTRLILGGSLRVPEQLSKPRPLLEPPHQEVDHLVVVGLQGDVSTDPRERIIQDRQEHVDEDEVDAQYVQEEDDGSEQGTGHVHGMEVELADEHLKTGLGRRDERLEVQQVDEVDEVEELRVADEDDREDDAEHEQRLGCVLQRRRQQADALVEAQQTHQLDVAEEDEHADHVHEHLAPVAYVLELDVFVAVRGGEPRRQLVGRHQAVYVDDDGRDREGDDRQLSTKHSLSSKFMSFMKQNYVLFYINNTMFRNL